MAEQSPSFLYLEIAEALRRLIATGELAPGDRLPPVREMARRWLCTPGTVGRAYAVLAKEGLVEGHRGSGTRVAISPLQAQDPVLHWASLVNRAERFLLEAVAQGYTTDQAEDALTLAASRWRDYQAQEERRPPLPTRPEQGVLRFVGSHDLLIESLARMLADQPAEARLEVEFVGSLGGLIALAQGRAEIAGSHLWDETTDTYNAPFVRRLLPGRRLALVTLAHRSLGLILPPGNPQDLHQLQDLARPDVTLVNRQPGSGTRVWLDAQLKASSIEPASISGYEREELTHLAVARSVADGEATTGLGIHAAAAAYGLAFAPLTLERYDLVIPAPVWELAATRALVDKIRSDRFRETVRTLGGYDTSETGQETWVY